MKRTRCCPKCQSRRVGCLERQYDSGSLGRGRSMALSKFVTEPQGALEAYVCADCGYHESYVANPEEIRWDELKEFRWVNPELPGGDGPFR